MLTELTALSPLDGRYREKIKHLSTYFSEYALIRYRVFVELEWLIFICNEVKLEGTHELADRELKILREISTSFEVADAQRVKDIEKTTNHDVKAVEYFIREQCKAHPLLAELSEFIHFGCTSEDINNMAYSLMMKDFLHKEFLPMASGVVIGLFEMAKSYKSVPMLAHTHGQPASPTTVGKELINVVARLEQQLGGVKKIELTAKWSGATGNFNAHVSAYRELDWAGIAVRFMTYMGLKANLYTTQIEPHDSFAEIFDAVRRTNTILIDLARDMWSYISLGYFRQRLKEGEIGSSTMPHKVNPIDFENAEGNLGLANAVFGHLSEKLPISRLQRDLTDSTVLRNVGVGFGYSVIAYKSLLNGLAKVSIDEKRLADDLDANWEVLAEAIQTVLRRHKVADAYEQLKELTRGKKLSAKSLETFIAQLKIPQSDKKYLLGLTPATYTGLAEKLVDAYRLSL